MTPEEIQQKIIEGTKRAQEKLIQQRKKEDGYLILSKDGKPDKVRARKIKD